jgi:hypothetical protein
LILLTLGSLVVIGAFMGVAGLRRSSVSGGRNGKVLIVCGALLCLLSAGFYLFMIVLVAGGT